jgi:hypothetical protein
MGIMDQLGGVLGKYTGAGSQPSEEDVHRDFDQVNAEGPHPELAGGVAAAFRSDKTPPFPHMLGKMFGQGNGHQRAGLLNTLIGAAGPDVSSRVLGHTTAGRELKPEEAEQVSPEAASALAREAEKRDPSIIDRISQLSAAHPGLVKSLGAGALSLVLAHAAGRHH